MATKLTEAIVGDLTTPGVLFDGGHDKKVPGFGVRVTPGGSKAFILDYRIRGRQRRFTIGAVGTWSVLAARKQAGELRRLIDQGRDPMAERERDREAPLMSDLFDRYLTEYAAPKKKPRSLGEDVSLIHGGKNLPAAKPFNGPLGKWFAKMQVAVVSYEDVERFHASLRANPYRANRALALLSKALNLAEKWKVRPYNSNPCGHVDRFPEEKRSRYLSGDELGRLGKALQSSGEAPRVSAAIQLLLFTGCRVSELLGVRWADIDLKAGFARLPDAKAGARDVQLSTPAQELLTALPRDGELVFGGLTYGQLETAWRRIRETAELSGVRLHDMRHTTGTMAGAAGYNAFLVRDLLGHKTLAMTGRYVERHSDPVRAAADAIGAQITAAMKGERAEIIGLPKRGKKT